MSTSKSQPINGAKRAFSRAEMFEAARRWMFETRGAPRGMDEETRDRFHEDLGLLIDFLGELIPEVAGSGALSDEHSSPVERPAQSAWASWSKPDLAREILARMNHFYGRTDGAMAFPSSAEGDLLKLVHALLSPNRNDSPSRHS